MKSKGCIFYGEKVRNYPYELKIEAIRLHIEEGWTYRRIMEHLGIPDRHRLKIWMKKYKQTASIEAILFHPQGDELPRMSFNANFMQST
ncbi:hypothetical protein BBR47_07710 [Brevibacillus brevis NBRC 100599]|uniref:Transposase n=1 Tax=Brevibacillus brevis (strain 47 / JCM 6285 / NBRC 100599) TaxID=358681 RepID=C0Z4M1_BREBN|nr:hypothetical protein BBR47_07710 [Brevibacillus brevis NBRC 100599]